MYFLLRWNSHKINHFKVNNSTAFIVLCDHHLYSVPSHSHHPIRKFCHVKWLFPISPSLLPLVTTNLSSVSMDLPILCISYKWIHTICDLSRLVSFTYNKCFWGSPMFPHAPVLHSFLRLDNIPLYGCATICLSIHPVTDIRAVST